MVLGYASTGSVDLFRLIFEEILKVSPSLLYKYSTLQEQILNLILLPHVVLFLFLFGLGWAVIPENKGLRYLIMVVAYIFVVVQGWYGTFLIPLLQTWFWITLIVGLFLFFMSRILHPLTAKGLGATAGKLAHDIGKSAGREKQIERLEEELKQVKRDMREYKDLIKTNPGAAQVYAQLSGREFELKRKIKELEK